MSEPFLRRLSRFTPDAGGLDRDSLLYAAGRASVRPNRAWIVVAAALFVTQALTLALLLRPTAPPASPPPPAAQPPVAVPPEPTSSDPSDSPGLWSVRHGLLDPTSEDRPAPVAGALIESEPPLRAFAPPSSILN
jgi:hypothetical protein